MHHRILIVEDNADLAFGLRNNLEIEGYGVDVAVDGVAGLARARELRPDLIILDLMLPGLDGLSICRAVRRETLNRDVPILMLTARRDETDKVLGLDSGADDYLTKPFGVRELLARVRAVMRRRSTSPAAGTEPTQRPLAFRHIEIDPARRRVRVRGREVELTNQEFNLLYVLLSQPGIVLSREILLRRAWPDDTFVTVRSVDTLVKRLRRKVEDDPANPTVILTVWGSGYKATDADA